MKYFVWGYAKSWIINGVDAAGQVVWSSHWMATKGEAETLASMLGWDAVQVAA
ncbi:hypothetical protein [Stenotrophomonas bentonitica]|uniref:hypothetical protein n=1 Tax=Stenotrophomonas bentonitica TaxID=1450134 RepID=UPI00142D355B|nr:hypothetical protein [Stenotrophomonas bentonitica]